MLEEVPDASGPDKQLANPGLALSHRVTVGLQSLLILDVYLLVEGTVTASLQKLQLL